jgi:hypothetical protein
MGKIDGTTYKYVVCEVNFVLFNSMLKYVINRLIHAFFHFRTVIIPRPISTLGLKPTGPDFFPDICPWVGIAVVLPVFTYGQN